MIAIKLQEAVQNHYMSRGEVSKSEAVDHLVAELKLMKKGKLYLSPENDYGVRFSFSTKSSFANTVLALKNVLKYDHLPLILCLLKPTTYEFLLINTTFLKKITHSSLALTETNIRGSFLGHDIIREIELPSSIDHSFMLANEPEHFDQLFDYHQSIEQSDNIARLVASTANIAQQKDSLTITDVMKQRILQSIHYSFEHKDELVKAKHHLDEQLRKCTREILDIVSEEEDNVNLRGNRIEQLLTAAGQNQHGLADEVVKLADGGRLLIDIKTSTGSISANAKLYNVDKQLEALSDGKTICALYLVSINKIEQTIQTYMINSFDETILDHLLVQHHWSGRNTRGATQLNAKVFQTLTKNDEPRLNLTRVTAYVEQLIALN